MALYLTDTHLTERLPSLTDTDLSTSAARDRLRTQASAKVDSVFPSLAPFAAITATPATPTLVNLGAVEYALWLALRLLSKNPDDQQAATCLQNFKDLFQIDDKTGLARVSVDGDLGDVNPIVDLTRSREDEERDDEDNEEAFYP